jgi:hypothetical protein
MTQEPTKLVDLADRQLAQIDAIVEKALKTPKRSIRWLQGVVAVLVLGATFIAYLYFNQVNLTHSVQQQSHSIQQGSIASCEAGNLRAATDAANWNYFIDILVKGDTKPADLAEVKVIKAHIAKADASRDCNAVYGK